MPQDAGTHAGDSCGRQTLSSNATRKKGKKEDILFRPVYQLLVMCAQASLRRNAIGRRSSEAMIKLQNSIRTSSTGMGRILVGLL